MQWHRWARLRLMVRRSLFQSLALLLLAMSAILLFFDVDLLRFTCSFAVALTLGGAWLASCLAEAWELWGLGVRWWWSLSR